MKLSTSKTIALLLAVSILCVFWPATRASFINFDDKEYVTENTAVLSGISLQGLKWAFTTGHASNWHPLTWISHMLDIEIYGLNPAGHHVTNVLLHTLNVLLVFAFLRQLTGSIWRSALVAASFGLHPLRVESVAWVSERKDVLCACFGLLALIAYAKYVVKSRSQNTRSRVWYAVALFCFALGLMSKPMLVTWPFVMLLLDYWPLRRVAGIENGGWKMAVSQLRPLVVEKLPFFALTAAASLTTYWVQARGGAVQGWESLALSTRIGNAALAYCRYLGKIFWPEGLSVYYPLPGAWPIWEIGLALLFLAFLTAFVLYHFPARPSLIVGWFWYVGTLVPVIGIIQVGGQSMADRYTYLPSIGIGIALAFSIPVTGEMIRLRAMRLASLVLFAICALLTHRQIQYWQDSERLFHQALRVDEANFMAHFCLGNELADRGRVQEALVHLTRCRELNPTFPNVLGRLGFLSESVGDYESAINYYRQALALKPNMPEALNNLAWLLSTCPQLELRDSAEAVRAAELACQTTR